MSSNHNSNATAQAVMDQAEARSLRSQADELEAGSTPDPLLAEFMRHDAAALEKSSANALALVKSPPIGSGGELVPTGGQVKRGVNLIDTVERPDAITAEASMDRLKLAMTFAGKAKSLIEDEGGNWQRQDTACAAEAARVANSAARMMDAFQKGTLALHKLRTGGKQVVTVQHVNVTDGGQALVTGGISTGDNHEN